MSTETFASAARSFATLTAAIPADAWDGPGLGDWDLRSLVGHASRSLITVSTYLQTPADREDVAGPADYYARMREYTASASAVAVLERGRQAGRDLGDDPVATINALLDRVLKALAAVDDPLIEVIGGLGIRLSNYLPTRVFELAVHSLDIARTTGIDAALPSDVLSEAVALAGQIAVLVGDGAPLLLALTGRTGLPPSFSVV